MTNILLILILIVLPTLATLWAMHIDDRGTLPPPASHPEPRRSDLYHR